MDLDKVVAKRDEAASRQDEPMTKRRDAMLKLMAMEASGCAAMSSMMLMHYEKRREALNHGAVVVSQMYAIAVILRAAADLKIAPLLADQVDDYEAIAEKLGPKARGESHQRRFAKVEGNHGNS